MNRIFSIAAGAALIAFTLPLGQAAPRMNNEPPATEAAMTLNDVYSWSVAIANKADEIEASRLYSGYSGADLEGLNVIRADVNQIGTRLKALIAERGSLAEWECRALDEVYPLMQKVAENSDKAIRSFDTDRTHLWATPFYEDMNVVFNDASQVRDLLGRYLKLDSVQKREQHLEKSVEELSTK
jgi:hypothetical protein